MKTGIRITIFLSFLTSLIFLGACGVKAPPVGIKNDPAPSYPIYVCTPKHPECDLTDSKYEPTGAPYEIVPKKPR